MRWGRNEEWTRFYCSGPTISLWVSVVITKKALSALSNTCCLYCLLFLHEAFDIFPNLLHCSYYCPYWSFQLYPYFEHQLPPVFSHLTCQRTRPHWKMPQPRVQSHKVVSQQGKPTASMVWLRSCHTQLKDRFSELQELRTLKPLVCFLLFGRGLWSVVYRAIHSQKCWGHPPWRAVSREPDACVSLLTVQRVNKQAAWSHRCFLPFKCPGLV